ncbi:DUF2946 domain-containing protein [Rhodoferax sp.]|uniref:DUF2946 domain-containing protein n=1 Tax=Rhodoferax sp. TaxID=50421 RepID=UPI0028469F38|nr:DUF2946 domain-containing protein [Rhodoferax sp.]MDR3369327.1 DUF2946 domain-containing protein [Rhodoferax sp.]
MTTKPIFVFLRRPWAVWLALFIAVFAALAPTVSHAITLARGGDAPLVEICTSEGPRWMALKLPADSPDVPPWAVHPEHCPFCLHASDRVAPPPSISLPDFGVPGDPVAPTLGQACLSVTHFAPAPPPRGPPYRLL